MSRSRVAMLSVMLALASAGLSLVWPIRSGTGVTSAGPASVPADLAAACAGDNPYLVTACFQQAGSGAAFERLPAVVAFRDTPSNQPHYLLATQGQVGAVYGLAYNDHEPAVYAAAYHRRETAFGPGGPGAIYRIDLTTGDVSLWATVPEAGPDRHEHRVSAWDRSAMPWAGRTSLGDLDWAPTSTPMPS